MAGSGVKGSPKDISRDTAVYDFLPPMCRQEVDNQQKEFSPFCGNYVAITTESLKKYKELCPDGRCDPEKVKRDLRKGAMRRAAMKTIEGDCKKFAPRYDDPGHLPVCKDHGKKELPHPDNKQSYEDSSYASGVERFRKYLRASKEVENTIMGGTWIERGNRTRLANLARRKLYSITLQRSPTKRRTFEEAVGEIKGWYNRNYPQPKTKRPDVTTQKEPEPKVAEPQAPAPKAPADVTASKDNPYMELATKALAALEASIKKLIHEIATLRSKCRDQKCHDNSDQAPCHPPQRRTVTAYRKYRACLEGVKARIEKEVQISPHRSRADEMMRRYQGIKRIACKQDKQCGQAIDKVVSECKRPEGVASVEDHKRYTHCLEDIAQGVAQVIKGNITESRKRYIREGVDIFDKFVNESGNEYCAILGKIVPPALYKYTVKLWRKRFLKELESRSGLGEGGWMDQRRVKFQILKSITDMILKRRPGGQEDQKFVPHDLFNVVVREVLPFEAEVTEYYKAHNVKNDPKYAYNPTKVREDIARDIVFSELKDGWKSWKRKLGVNHDAASQLILYHDKLEYMTRVEIKDSGEDVGALKQKIRQIDEVLELFDTK